MNLHQIINNWLGEDVTTPTVHTPNCKRGTDKTDHYWCELSDKQVGYNTALEDLRNRIPELEKEIEKLLKKEMACPECEGSGTYQSPSDYSPCSFCDGTGLSSEQGNFNDLLKTLTSKE